jgi:hypothetical protein
MSNDVVDNKFDTSDSNVVTFQDIKKRYTITAKAEFLTQCPDPHNYRIFDLHEKFHLFKYLHNPSGFAVVKDSVHKKHGRILRQQVWLNGHLLFGYINGKPAAVVSKEELKDDEFLDYEENADLAKHIIASTVVDEVIDNFMKSDG